MKRNNHDVYIAPRLNSSMSNRGEEETVHHRLCTSRGGSNHQDNKVKLYKSLHEARHRVFGNGTIDEQLTQVLDIRGPGLSQEFRRDIIKVIERGGADYYYANGILLPK